MSNFSRPLRLSLAVTSLCASLFAQTQTKSGDCGRRARAERLGVCLKHLRFSESPGPDSRH